MLIENLSNGALFNLLFSRWFISFITFVIAIFLTRFFAKNKEWDDSTKTAFEVSFLWFILNALLEFEILIFLGSSIIFDSIRIALGIIVISKVIAVYYDKKFVESLIFTIIIQGLLYAISTIIGLFLRGYNLLISGINEEIAPAGMMYFVCILLMISIGVFYMNAGTKIQFIKSKNFLLLVSLVPGLNYLTEEFYAQEEIFMRLYTTNIMWSIVITVIIITIIKVISFRFLSFEEYRELSVLEKDIVILELNNLKVYYPLIGGMLKRQFGSVKAVDGITFNIKTGETVGLVGESGCGKTTVANAILGLVPKESGDIIFDGEPIPNKYSRILRQKIQIVFQDPDASLNPRMKVVNIIAEPLKNLLGITKGDELRRRVLKLLEEVSLKREHMDRYPHEFSGGQKQRIIIARALASNPELIILDEPTSALDVSVQAQILNLLKALQKTYGYGFLFITHNLAVVNHIADRVAVMYLGKFVEIGKTEQIFSKPTHPYTIALLESRTELDPTNKEIRFVIKGEVPSPIAPPPGCTFNPRCVSDAKTKECMRETPHRIEIEEDHYIWCLNPPVSMQGDISLSSNESDTDVLEN